MQLRDEIVELSGKMTPSERKLAAVLLSDYPYAALDTIQALARKSHVSAPSITRFVQKLGCQGYQDFQRRLIEDLKEGARSPVDLHRADQRIGQGYLRGFLSQSNQLVSAVGEGVSEEQFQRVCGILADPGRSVFLIGGRISDAIAQYFSRHLRHIRGNVFHLPADSEAWPDYLLRMRARDALFTIDFRRYERRLAHLANLAVSSRHVKLILLTDKWISPIAKDATDVFAVPTASTTAWDSFIGAISLVEAMISWISDQDWDATRHRIEAWDSVRIESRSDGDNA